METTTNRNTATLLQLSAFTQYFIPLGNFIFPTIIWSARKNESAFVDYNGKQAINFQLSIFMYTLVLIVVCVPVFIYAFFNNLDFSFGSHGKFYIENFSFARITWLTILSLIAGFLFFTLKVVEFFLIFYASVKNSNGQNYDYPLTIKFIK